MNPLAPFRLELFHYREYSLRFREPIEIAPVVDSEGFELIYEPLGIHVWGFSREELARDLEYDIGANWRDYALADDSALAPDAQALKVRLLAAIEEI